MSIKCCVVGASGYTGAELVKILERHPYFKLTDCFVSTNSVDAGKAVGEIHKSLNGISNLIAKTLDENTVKELRDKYDAIFLATPHEASHAWAKNLAFGHAKVFDLSGAFRLSDTCVFEKYYGFEHAQKEVLRHSVYGLAEWYERDIALSNFIAVPGCYPTASLLAIKPIVSTGLLLEASRPIINAVSGVSGAGRKLSTTSQFCEVSLQAYGVLSHRHTPEIEEYAGTPIIFTPHLGQYKRGILTTVTMQLTEHATNKAILDAFNDAYMNKPLIRMTNSWPKVDDVAHTPFCDIAWKFDAESRYIVVCSAIDNLLKGAASQAIQCANLVFDFDSNEGLM